MHFISLAVLVFSANAATIAPGFNSGVPGGTSSGRQGGNFNWDQQQQSQFRPFGSDRPCSALVNETLTQNDGQVIIERILIQADTMGNSFSSSSFTGGSNQQLDTWAAQACGQMQNVVGYLKSACQFSSSGSSSMSSGTTEMVAQKKLAAMNAVKDYLCANNQVNLKELAMNNGAQCARRTDLSDFGCNLQQGSQPSFIPMLPSNARQTLKYGTAIILNMFSYNGDECRYIAEVTNCIVDKYTRGTDFCSTRAATHFGRIFDVMQQGVQCKSGGYSTFNNFDSSTSFNNNPSFNRFPNSNSGSFQNFPQSNFPQSGTGFGSSQNSNWPQNQNNFGQQPGSSQGFGSNANNNWPQNGNNQNSFGQNQNWPQNPNNQQGSFGQGSNTNFGSNSGLSYSATIPPYNPNNRRPYYGAGSVVQATMATVMTAIFAAFLAI